MTESWATFGADLHLDLATGRGLRAGLAEALREAARSGRLAPGTRLPSSRSLAADLAIARNTVAEAYAELVAEGWLTARQGSGTRVAERARPRRTAAAPAARVRPPVHRGPAYSLISGSPDLGGFPRAAWAAATRRALVGAPNEALGYAVDARGRVELREALAGYLARARGVYADPGRIVLCAGFAHGLMLLSKVLRGRRVRDVAVEGYGLGVHRELLTGAGLRTHPLRLDAAGARTDELPGKAVGAVLLTPAHQFPTGVALTPERRTAAVDWARTTGGLILEDDYDGEFRYDRQPVGALQGLDPDRVVYLGTASKSLAPGLRMGWMVVPQALLEEVLAAKGHTDWTSGAVEQLTLAEFIRSGAYDRHVRGMRTRYRRRRDAVVEAVSARASVTGVAGIAAGLHVVLDLARGMERPVLQAAAGQGLALEGLSAFRHPLSDLPPREAVVVGYGNPPDSAWSPTLSALLAALP
ncbi:MULTISPECIES: MocR-like pyridoxine biosynthesis transcription factor PdxR [unclassified Streptomyces]|uniref:MocR-like pyridoxine biosynthesis transcription factor PdxR n=1 Tax=unclassified Streptomyces TaxID=2593676 RepID=UPI002E32A034|nr:MULTISPECIES: PLP-dependent aminotransferase family protein [unclassified Streptomyces]WUC64988.1 PLP-dependent aminotransferase family protein [Streptomyces sp. NBC_00539]